MVCTFLTVAVSALPDEVLLLEPEEDVLAAFSALLRSAFVKVPTFLLGRTPFSTENADLACALLRIFTSVVLPSCWQTQPLPMSPSLLR